MKKLQLFKKLSKRTDVCDICKGAKQMKKYMNEKLNEMNDNELILTISNVSAEMNCNEIDEIIEQLRSCELLSALQFDGI